jgi:hypothetical protein
MRGGLVRGEGPRVPLPVGFALADQECSEAMAVDDSSLTDQRVDRSSGSTTMSRMRWATTTFRVNALDAELRAALDAWRGHIVEAHPDIKEVRCYSSNGGTEIMWQEGFEDFNAYQRLIEEEDERCEAVMVAVFRHEVPGTRSGRILNDVIAP